MRFEVPQFIEIEDKIFGPLTFRQFVYLVGGAGVCVMLYVGLPNFIAYVLIIPVIALSLALAFYEVNKRPFIYTLEHAVKYVLKPRLYVWQQRERKVKRKKSEGGKESDDVVSTASPVPRVSNSKLKDMAWSLGVRESLYAETQEGQRSGGVDPTQESRLAPENITTEKEAKQRMKPQKEQEKEGGEEKQEEATPSTEKKRGPVDSYTDSSQEEGGDDEQDPEDIKSRLNIRT